MCQRKGEGPRCFSDSKASLNAVERRTAKLSSELDSITSELASVDSGSRRYNTLLKRKSITESKLRQQERKRRSVLRDLDATKTGRKNLLKALSAVEYGSREWRELDLRRRNAEAASVQLSAMIDFNKSGRVAPIRFKFA